MGRELAYNEPLVHMNFALPYSQAKFLREQKNMTYYLYYLIRADMDMRARYQNNKEFKPNDMSDVMQQVGKEEENKALRESNEGKISSLRDEVVRKGEEYNLQDFINDVARDINTKHKEMDRLAKWQEINKLLDEKIKQIRAAQEAKKDGAAVDDLLTAAVQKKEEVVEDGAVASAVQ